MNLPNLAWSLHQVWYGIVFEEWEDLGDCLIPQKLPANRTINHINR